MEIGLESGQGPSNCNKASCHSCGLLPETSCEVFNRFLDRGVLIGTPANPGAGNRRPSVVAPPLACQFGVRQLDRLIAAMPLFEPTLLYKNKHCLGDRPKDGLISLQRGHSCSLQRGHSCHEGAEMNEPKKILFWIGLSTAALACGSTTPRKQKMLPGSVAQVWALVNI